MVDKTQMIDVFNKYTDSNDLLKGRMYIKMFKEANLAKLPSEVNRLDLIFAKYKSKSSGINYETFLKSLDDVGKKLNCSKSEIEAKLSDLTGPIYTGTQPDPVRFHDDKSLYTGVHVHGGPSVIDLPKKTEAV
ncbi:vesicular cargo protein [Theileria orientalis strain Shintoku]|uniref:Vesicular cargo protein n=1 Tax=Theileria orientalis strain Shintoku TaxID=869250 RepID=J4DNR5_THEOR|nr:vesicular cargo protein [Theileria orientalis strain Shintoku]PVC53336.1 vesicular cargo protein [Theileria orientalis]BAM39419.1 vesicular cargo protein [Theileria orientalis strain Shintoku]|eukprot:XP_009689720.1 vesicular cargo protein [Theileria orientalis strain Shintoku]